MSQMEVRLLLRKHGRYYTTSKKPSYCAHINIDNRGWVLIYRGFSNTDHIICFKNTDGEKYEAEPDGFYMIDQYRVVGFFDLMNPNPNIDYKFVCV